MKFDEYQKQAIRSVAITDKSIAALSHRTLGLSGEAGIVSNAMKKVIRDKAGELSKEDKDLLKEKIGDVIYYAAVLADYADLSLEEIIKANMQKSSQFLDQRN